MISLGLFLSTFAVTLFLLRTLFYGDFIILAGLATISWFLADMITKTILNNLPKNAVDGHNKAVFITGCDTGFGHELAIRLDAMGFSVYAGCLFPDKDGALELKEKCSDRMQIVPIDVTKDEVVQKAAKYVKETLGNNTLWAIVNNAGIATFTEIEWCPIETYEKVIDVNTMGLIRVTKAFLPLIRESSGRVVIVASLAGRYTFPGFSAYSMSKHAAVSFADGLRREMKKWGITVHSIEPTLYKTPIAASESLLSNLKSLWDRTPTEIQESYGEEYFKAFQEKLLRISTTAKGDINEVVEDMLDAVAGQRPKTRYVPSTAVQLRARLLTAIPTELQDFILCKTGPQCKPAAVVQNDLKTLPILQKISRELRRTQSEPPGTKNKAMTGLSNHTKNCLHH